MKLLKWITIYKINSLIIKSFVFISIVMFFCEFIIYYLSILQCKWPLNQSKQQDDYVKIMLLADTHLLGHVKGHWFDKLRREWQMYRSFQTAVQLFAPEIIIILGDIFDEGLWANPNHFREYFLRFHDLFHVNNKSKVYIVVGNHDIGFHYWTDNYLVRRFEIAFNISSVDWLDVGKGVNLIRINSIAMEGDDCYLCRDAVEKLYKISSKLPADNQPILLTHFPLYRESDDICNEVDSVDFSERMIKFRSKIDCLSYESSKLLLRLLKPRLVFSGHTHYSCIVNHSNIAQEWSVASFSWRNNKHPSFLLAQISQTKHFISKCFLPNEYYIFFIYSVSALSLFFYNIYSIRFIYFKRKQN